MPKQHRLVDKESLKRIVTRLSHEVLEKIKPSNMALVGIRTRGVPLAERLAYSIYSIEGIEIPIGELDITLFRDDLGTNNNLPEVRMTSLPFSVDGKEIVLVDDVLYTGRSVKAAIDALMEYGRPKSIRLLVLVDRGHRELPIRADFIGKNIPTARSEKIKVSLSEFDGEDAIDIFGDYDEEGTF